MDTFVRQARRIVLDASRLARNASQAAVLRPAVDVIGIIRPRSGSGADGRCRGISSSAARATALIRCRSMRVGEYVASFRGSRSDRPNSNPLNMMSVLSRTTTTSIDYLQDVMKSGQSRSAYRSNPNTCSWSQTIAATRAQVAAIEKMQRSNQSPDSITGSAMYGPGTDIGASSAGLVAETGSSACASSRWISNQAITAIATVDTAAIT